MTDEAGARRRRPGWFWPVLVLVALAGLVLRLWNVDFDQRQHLHPDERHWSLTASGLQQADPPARHGTLAGPVLDWLDGQRSPANAYRGTDSFVYGPVTLAGTRAVAGWLHDGAVDGSQPASAVVSVADGVGLPLLDADGAPRFDDGYQVDLIGRVLGALTDALTIVVVGLIGRRVRGDVAGLAAAGLAAGSVLAIQHAHFFGAEPLLGLVSAVLVLALLGMDRGERPAVAARSGALVGVAAGALVAVKLSGAGLALLPFGAAIGLLARHRRRADVVRLVAMAVGAAVAFRVVCPSAFDGLGLGIAEQFRDDLRRSQEATDAGLPPSIQWAARTPLDPLRWLLVFTVGPGAAAAAVAGLVSLWRRGTAAGRWVPAVLASAWLVPMAFVFRGSVTTGRYFVPMLPALYACGGIGVAALVDRARAATPSPRAGSRWGPRLAGSAAVAVLALSTLWGVAFTNGVHGSEHTRVQASRWIAAHVEPGSTLSIEAWDDGLPLAVPGVTPSDYELVELDLFGVDRVEKAEALARSLGTIDHVVESSPRVWRAVTRVPARYPSTIRFFEALDSGDLGFERVATFTSPPRLGPWRLDDGGAEEAFSVYDHPEVRIWRKVRTVPERELLAQLDPVRAATALEVHPDAAHAGGALLRDEERAENDRIGTYAQDFDLDADPAVHVVGWLVLVELLGLAGFAIALPVLRSLPDAGAGLAKLLGLLGPATLVFVLATWGGQVLTRGLVAAVVLAWLAAGAGCGWRRRAGLAEVWQRRRRAIVQVEAITLGAFALVLALRAANPDLWHVYRGGEKPFELEMFTAVLRTRTLPPYDPWFAGGTLNYYYGGYLLLSIPARILATPPALAMGLGLATVASLAAGAVWSAGAALADRVPRPDAPAPATHPARRAGALAVLLVLVLPNAAIVPSIVGRVLRREGGVLDWWGLTRVDPGSPIVSEFPAWSFLFGDLHPHVMGLPLLAAVVALAVAGHRALVAAERWPIVLGGAVVAGVAVGAVRATNTWDLPLAALLVAVVPALAWRSAGVRRRVVGWVSVVVVVVVVAWAPYAWRTEVADAGLVRESLHTPFGSWLRHFGLLAAATLVVLGSAAVRRTWSRRAVALALGTGVAVAATGVLVRPQASFLAAATLAGACGAVAWTAGRQPITGAVGAIPPAVLALGWAMVAGIEQVSVANDFERQNTVFKGWYQAWLLLALGLAVALAGAAAPARRLRARVAHRGWPLRSGTYAARVVLVVVALVVTAFVQLAVPARLDDRTSTGGPSLDGLAYLDAGLEVGPRAYDPGDDRPLIAWLQANVRGVATIAEAPGDDYSWAGRVAAHTGLASVVGWPYHQRQQRRAYEAAVDERVGAMATLYTSGDPVAITAALQRFDVAFVVFGTVEAALADDDARAALLRHPCLAVAFEHEGTFVAEVDRPCLAGQPGGLPARPGRVTPRRRG